MSGRASRFIVLLLLVYCTKSTVILLNSCPSLTLWQPVAEKTCKNANTYHCLSVVESSNYAQSCQEPTLKAAGSRVKLDTNVRTGMDPQIITSRCHGYSYQPLPYYSNQLRDCIYRKSECNERGQVVFKDGTTTADKTCRCDHQKGYAFIFKTKNRCFCIPSQEDCTCYLKPCLNSSYILSSGYDCVISNKDGNICSFRKVGSSEPTSEPSIARGIIVAEYYDTQYNIQRNTDDYRAFSSITLIVVTAVILLFPGVCLIYRCGKAANRTSTPYDIIKDATKAELKNLKQDESFVVTVAYDMAVKALTEYGVVIIKGRYGTGKTTLALRLADDSGAGGFIPYKFDKPDLYTVQLLITKTRKHDRKIIILENVIDDGLQTNSDWKDWKAILKFILLFRGSIKIIVTTYFINNDLQECLLHKVFPPVKSKMHTLGVTSESLIVDLDELETITRDNKNKILMKKCKKYQRDFKSDFCDIQYIESIIGFPLMCTLFCSENTNFALGKLYFQTTSAEFIERIETLKNQGYVDTTAAIKYAVLVCIALANNTPVSFRKDSQNLKMLNELYKNIFKKRCHQGANLIQNLVATFGGQYLKSKNPDEFEFYNVGIKRAVLITYGKIAPIYIIETISLDELLNIIRPGKYKRRENEAIVLISAKDEYAKFSDRIAKGYTTTVNQAKNIGIFMYKYSVACNDFEFVESVLQSLQKHTDLPKNDTCIPFLIQIFYEMSNHCEVVLSERLKTKHFCLVWEIIVAAQCKSSLLSQLTDIVNAESEKESKEVVLKPIDAFANTLFHYFVVWGFDCGLSFCNKTYLEKEMDTVKNIFGFTPLYYAAYLGRHNYFLQLLKCHRKQNKTGLVLTSIPIFGQYFDKTTESEVQFSNIQDIKSEGEKNAGRSIEVTKSQTQIYVSKDIIPEITFGKEDQYDKISQTLNDMFKDVRRTIQTKEMKKAMNTKNDNVHYPKTEEHITQSKHHNPIFSNSTDYDE